MDPSHVLWIGGGQGSGKSSIAKALSRRFDLQLYNVDHRTWVHEARMPATEFGSLSMDERWVDSAPERMLRWFTDTSRHQFRLVLEDVRELPDSPMAVVEGPQAISTRFAGLRRGGRDPGPVVPRIAHTGHASKQCAFLCLRVRCLRLRCGRRTDARRVPGDQRRRR